MAVEKYSGLIKLSKIFIKRTKRDKDCPVAITGEEGCGKSTLAILLAIFIDKNFSFERNVIFMPTEDQVKGKIYSLPKHSPLVLDEAIKALYKRDWQTKARKEFNKIFAVCRKRNLSYFMCLPNFWDMDLNFKSHRIKIWIHVPKRGYAMVFMKSKNQFSDDPWNRIDNMKKVKKLSKGDETSTESVIQASKRLPNFMFDFEFPDLPKLLKKEYLYLCNHYSEKMEGDEDKEDDLSVREKKWREKTLLAIGLMKYKYKIKLKEIAHALQMDNHPIYSMDKEYRERFGIKTVNELNVERAKMIATKILAKHNADLNDD